MALLFGCATAVLTYKFFEHNLFPENLSALATLALGAQENRHM
jgi:hypothetical protein